MRKRAQKKSERDRAVKLDRASAARISTLVTITTAATFTILNAVWHSLTPDAPFPITIGTVGRLVIDAVGDIGEVHAIAFLLTAVVWVVLIAIQEMTGGRLR